MAVALEAVGVAASFVQLADVSIRTSLYLYSFFSSIHQAKDEFQRHVSVIRDIHDVIQLIRQMTVTQSFQPIEEEMLKKQLLSITHELSTLEKVTAGKDPAKLTVRLKWVLKSPEIDRALQELERRKSSLTILLQTITMKDSAQTRGHQDSNRMMLESLLSLVMQQNQQGALTVSDISTRLDGLSIQMDSTVQMWKESLSESSSALIKNHEVALEGYMDRFLQRAVDSYILPHIEQSLSKRSEMQNAATLLLIQEAMGQATDEMAGLVADITKDERIGQEESTPTQSPKTDANLRDPPLAPLSDNDRLTSKFRRSGICRSTGTKEWSYWASISSVGTFRVQCRSQNGDNGRFWTIQSDFWPSVTSLLSRCISLKYSSNYDPQGYMALFPSLAIHPIISKDHPIWNLIERGDLAGVRLQLREHRNGPHDQDSDGVSLLMYASWTGSLDVAQFLLTQGADPTRTNVSGFDSLRLLTGSVVNQVMHCHVVCPSWLVSTKNGFSLFFSLFHQFTDASCDLCNVSVFYFEEDGFTEREPQQESLAGRAFLFDDDYDSMIGREIGNKAIYEKHTPGRALDLVAKPIPLDSDFSRAGIRQVAQFLRHQELDMIEETSYIRPFLLLEDAGGASLPVLREYGLNRNYRRPARSGLPRLDCCKSLHDFYSSNSKVSMDNLIKTMSSGANIHYMERANKHWIKYVDDDGVMSPTAYAKAADFMPIWRHALRKAGFIPKEVFLEDERRRREFRRLHRAASSAVEIEDPPSSTVRRRLV